MAEYGTGQLGLDGAKTLLEGLLHLSTADQTEVVLAVGRQALTRFAANAIHQNVVEETPRLTIRAVFGRRQGTASTSRLDAEGTVRVLEQAAALARMAPENDDFHGLPAPADEPRALSEQDHTYSAATAQCSPAIRADLVAVACRMARAAGLEASGSVATSGQELAVANSLGTFAYTPRSTAKVVVVAVGETGSGYADESALDLAALDMEALAGRAVAIAGRAQNPMELAAGRYTVILQPEAVSDITSALSMVGFGARAVHEGRSFVTGHQGEMVLGSNVSIWDDGRDPSGLPLPFDVEGVPRQRLALIDRGVAGDIALDSYYGGVMGRPSTGHATQTDGLFVSGPMPLNMVLAPGESSVDEMIRSTERGLLVTRFHYTRVVHPLHVIITGMTRDGTFLIERGEIARPVKNLRYTQSYVEALRDVQAIGRETRLVGDWRSSRVPALKIGSFTFTGVTQ